MDITIGGDGRVYRVDDVTRAVGERPRAVIGVLAVDANGAVTVRKFKPGDIEYDDPSYPGEVKEKG